MNIMRQEDPRLYEKASMVTEFDETLATLLADMKRTMLHAGAIGIAAPQVGVSSRIVIVMTLEGPLELVNPVIVSAKGKAIRWEECLNVPRRMGCVRRPRELAVMAQDRHGNSFSFEVSGKLAGVISHELDHLNGELFVNKLIGTRKVNQPGLGK